MLDKQLLVDPAWPSALLDLTTLHQGDLVIGQGHGLYWSDLTAVLEPLGKPWQLSGVY